MANDKLIGAMKLAIAGTGAASGLVPLEAALAQQQAPPAPTAQPVTTLEEITVTGTHIRRVDAETASPVFVVDQKSIESTGAVTLGDLISRMPAISGSAQSTAVNNGGGFGESNIDLRGLGNPSPYTEPRTLIMLDGRRVNLIGSSNAVDVNQFPINMIERVEVLKEGAGAIYGSDAIAGVVNFITRKVEGFEVGADYGRTSESDGQHHSLSVAFGHSDETLSFVVGGNYNQQDSVSAGARDYSKYALYFYSGAVAKRGSSRTPNGRIGLPDPTNPLYTPAQAAAAAAMVAAFPGCSSITRIAGAVGSSLADYRCYSSATDSYNFQPLNLLLTPQERGSIFTKVNYKLSENLEAYGEVLFNRTHSGYQLAPLPFDITNDNVIVSAQNLYNPFGVDFGGLSGANPNARWRLTAVGDRRSDDTGESVMSWFGMRGKIADTGWQWDGNVNYSRLDQNRTASGYLNESALGNALGPSKLINGVPTCVDSSGNPIAAVCTPADIFNLSAPGQAAGLQGIAADVNSQNTARSYSFNLDLNGKVMTLPSGDMLASVGADYVGLAGKYQIDSNALRVPPLYLSCGVSSEECSGNSRAHYGVRELYGELFVPVLKDLPAVKSLNLDAGVRYSSYTIFGSTTKGQIKLEWRPYSDLLVRSTFAQVFRAPSITDISAAPLSNAPTFSDPCAGLTAAKLAANPNYALACVGVPLDGTFKQPLSQISSVITSNPNLKPEVGHVLTYGLVFNPQWLANFAVTLDFWKYKLTNVVTTVDPTYAENQCVATGDPTFCSLGVRYASGPNAGQFQTFSQPDVNLGALNTDGVDIGFSYVLKTAVAGNFQFRVDASHVNSYESIASPAAAPQELAGDYTKQFGNMTKWRGVLSVGWAYHDLDATLSGQYIGHLEIPNADGCATCTQTTLPVPSIVYANLTVGYIFPTKTRAQLGILNIANKQPPFFYNNNVLNANTDVSTYDTIGRRFFLSVTQKF